MFGKELIFSFFVFGLPGFGKGKKVFFPNRNSRKRVDESTAAFQILIGRSKSKEGLKQEKFRLIFGRGTSLKAILQVVLFLFVGFRCWFSGAIIRIPVIQAGMTIFHVLARFDHGTYHFVKVSKAKRHFKQQQMLRKLISRTGNRTWSSRDNIQNGRSALIMGAVHLPHHLTIMFDGRDPKQPPVIYETLWNMGYCPYQLVDNFCLQSTVWWPLPLVS